MLRVAENSGSTNILASNLSANNQINIKANNQLNIQSQEQVTNIVNSHSNITNTITLSVGNAWLGLADGTLQSAKRVEDSNNSKTDDKAKAANAAGASAQIGMNALQAIITAPSYGFYGAATETLSKTTSESQTNYINNLASNLYAKNEITLVSNNDLTAKGSNIISEFGNINLRSKEGNVNIESAQNSLTSNSSSQTNSISETVSVSGGGIFISIPTITNSRSSSDYNASSYLASNINATNGTININAKETTNIIGSNLLAKDINLATTNLNVESQQSALTSKNQSNSTSLGGNIGFNNSKQSQHRLWTDNIASIIATNSVTINATKNTSITGALIANITNATEIWLGSTLLGGNESTRSATMGGSLINATDGGNLTLNTKTLTTSNLNDYNNQSSSSIGLNIGLPVGFGTTPNGLAFIANPRNTNISFNYTDNKANQEQITKATIGSGTINLNSNIARDEKTGEVTSATGSETTSQIANLNRNLNNIQKITQNHTSGGYNIDLNVNLAIAAEAKNLFSQEGRTYLGNQAKQNLGGTVKLYGDSATKAYEVVAQTSQKIFNEIGVILTPAQKAEIDQAFANGNAQKVYELIEQRGITINNSTKEKIRQFAENEIGGNKFLKSLTPEERQDLVQPKTIGLFFDGTGNDAKRDLAKGEETNVWRLNKLYNGEAKYIKGVGSSGEFGDTFCQATGCGTSLRELEGMDKFYEAYNTFLTNGNNQPFIIADLVGFSRGAATSRDFANMLLNDGVKSAYGSIMPELIILRSVTPFDTVSSFGAPWNGVDIGKNFSTNLDTIIVHPTAEDEVRTNFGLQSIKPYEGAVLPSNWIERSFPGVHSDIGGSYADDFQGKSNDISKYTLNWAVNNVNSLTGEKVFNAPQSNWQPSTYLNVVMDAYLQAKANNDQVTTEAAKSIFQDKYIHNSEKTV